MLKVIEESKNKKIKNFWLGGLPGEDATQYKHIVKIPLDCLGSDSLSKSLQCYFTAYSKDKATFNEMLKMRFLVFFDNDNGFVTGLNRLRTVRNFFQHPEDPSISLRQTHLDQLTDFVHPIFINLLRGKVMSLAKGSSHEEPLSAAFYQLQKQGQEKRMQARRDFFGIYRTRTEKGRPITRQWEQFQKRWGIKKRQWQSRYHLHNFIDQYQRINPQGLKAFALQCAPNPKPIKTIVEVEEIAFEEIVLIHRLLSDIDLLLWGYLPDQPAHKGDRIKNNLLKLRNYLAHNHKIGLSKQRDLQTDFLHLLSALDLVKRNAFYTKLKAILTRQRGLYTEQGKRLRYQGQPLVDRKNLKKYQWLTQVAARIRRDLEAVRQELKMAEKGGKK